MDQRAVRLPSLASQLIRMPARRLLFYFGASSSLFLQNVPLTTFMFLIHQPKANSWSTILSCCLTGPQVSASVFQMNGGLLPPPPRPCFLTSRWLFRTLRKIQTILSQLWRVKQSLGESACFSYHFQCQVLNDKCLIKILGISSQIKFALMGDLCFQVSNTL